MNLLERIANMLAVNQGKVPINLGTGQERYMVKPQEGNYGDALEVVFDHLRRELMGKENHEFSAGESYAMISNNYGSIRMNKIHDPLSKKLVGIEVVGFNGHAFGPNQTQSPLYSLLSAKLEPFSELVRYELQSVEN